MAVAALILWVLTAGGGFYLLGTWFVKGGLRQRPRSTHLPPQALFGHFLLAVAGLVVWIVYLITGLPTLAWAAFVLLVLVALLGFVMFARWLPVYRAQPTRAPSPGPGATAASDAQPPERHFPVAIVGGHGLLAVATLILVLLTALGIGGG